MSLDTVYTCRDSEHALRLSDADRVCLERIRVVAPAAIDALFAASIFGEPVSSTVNELLAAVDALQSALRDRSDLLPATYQMRLERTPTGDTSGIWEGGAISGLRLPGEPDYFMLRVGPDQCELTRIQIGEDGRGVLAGTQDLRGREAIQTETVGKIELRRRPSGATLRKQLTTLRMFLQKLRIDEEVTIAIC